MKLFLRFIMYFILIIPNLIWAQTPVMMTSHDNGFVVVPVGSTSAEISFTVDNYSSILIKIIAPVDGVKMSVVNPSNTIIIPENDPSITFTAGNSMTPPKSGGVFLIDNIDNPVDGLWKLKFTFPSVVEKTVFMSTLMAQSMYQSGILADKTDYLTSDISVIGYLITKESKPILGLEPKIIVTSMNVNTAPVVLTARDDGLNGDGLANDGLYSINYQFNESGSYLLTGSVEISEGGKFINRKAETTVQVNDPRINVINTIITPEISSMGCTSAIKISMDVDVLEDGMYALLGKLSGSNGKILTTGKIDILTAGQQTLYFKFPAEMIEEKIGVLSSYNVEYIDGLFSDPMLGDVNAFEKQNIGAYTGQICIPPIAITPNLQVTEVMQGGVISSLNFIFPVTVDMAGKYTISYSIVGPNGENIENAMLIQNLAIGTNLISATVVGEKFINVDGPYRIVSVLVVGNGKSAIRVDVGSSKFYSKLSFRALGSAAQAIPALNIWVLAFLFGLILIISSIKIRKL